MRYVANVSHGKDSQAMLYEIIDRGLPLDEVVFYSNGMDFSAIDKISEQTKKLCEDMGVVYTVLHPATPFEYDMFERPVSSKQKGEHFGYGWCGGVCRWGTTYKTKTLDQYAARFGEHKTYIGIAADELKRIEKERKPNVILPLVDFQMAERDCLSACRDRGVEWLEQSPVTESGYIDLYDILDRVSCWCCCNKNQKELFNIWIYLPQYWERLKAFQSRLERPMKNWKSKKHGDYGNVFAMEKVFEERLQTMRKGARKNERFN